MGIWELSHTRCFFGATNVLQVSKAKMPNMKKSYNKKVLHKKSKQ